MVLYACLLSCCFLVVLLEGVISWINHVASVSLGGKTEFVCLAIAGLVGSISIMVRS